MKKLLHPLIFMFLSVNVFAQTNLFSDDFESYSTDQKLAEQSSATEWTTWSNDPGSAEDVAISEEQASSGTKSAKIVTNNDLILLLGEKITGRYQVKFNIYVADGNSAFVGFMQDFDGSDADFGMTLYFNADTGELNAGGKTYQFDYAFDQWLGFNTIIDLDDDFATLYLDGNEMASWTWSKGAEGGSSLNSLFGVDFWGYNESNGCQYYIDDVEYNEMTSYDPPLNLASTLNEKVVLLNWEAPAAGTPDEYAVLRNGKVIARTSELNYNDSSLLYPGDFNYKVKARMGINGYSESSNEVSETITGQSSQRMVLIEHFTNASCGPCAQQNPVLDQLMNEGTNPDKVAHIAYHTSWPGTDPMYTFNNSNDMGNARVSRYGVSGVPDAVVGGNQFHGSPANISQESIDDEYARAGLFDITSGITIDEHDSIFVDVECTSFANFKSGNLTAYVVLVEDMEYYSAPGSNGETVFPDVMRDMFPDENGQSIGLPAMDDVINLSYKRKLDSEIGDNLQLVVFIQNDEDDEVYMTYLLDDDFTPPSVKITPANGTTNISTSIDVELKFSEAIRNLDDTEISDLSSIYIFRKNDIDGEDVELTASINDSKTIITLDPNNDLESNQDYFVSVIGGTVENATDLVNPEESVTFTTKSTTGIGKISENEKVKLYPNPCIDHLNIELTLEEPTRVKIGVYNEVGQLVKLVDEGNLTSGNQKVDINLDRLSSGFYFVNVNVGSNKIVKKIQILK